MAISPATPALITQLIRSGLREFTYTIDSNSTSATAIHIPINIFALAIHPDSDIDQCQIEYLNKAGETITARVGVGSPHFFKETALPYPNGDRAIKIQITSQRNWTNATLNNNIINFTQYGWGNSNNLPTLKLRAYFGAIPAQQIPSIRHNKLRFFTATTAVPNAGKIFAAPTFGRRWIKFHSTPAVGISFRSGIWVVGTDANINFASSPSASVSVGCQWAGAGAIAHSACSPWRFDWLVLASTGSPFGAQVYFAVECGDN